MAYLPLREEDTDLVPLLRNADNDDLAILVEFIMKASTSELGGVPNFKQLNPRAIQEPPVYEGDHGQYVDDIAAEIQKFGGNTIINFFRSGKGVPYAEVLRDVADKLDVNYNEGADASTIEGQIQIKVLEKAYEKMTEEERKDLLDAVGADHRGGIPAMLPVMAIQAAIRLGGFAAYQMALIVANAVARQVLGHGLRLAANAGIMRIMGALAGPIGWAITIIWTLLDIAGPAYRVTIPCVLQVAYMRQKNLITTCPAEECGAVNPKTAKFCQSCGHKLG